LKRTEGVEPEAEADFEEFIWSALSDM
jgi:hypothetical protein